MFKEATKSKRTFIFVAVKIFCAKRSENSYFKLICHSSKNLGSLPENF